MIMHVYSDVPLIMQHAIMQYLSIEHTLLIFIFTITGISCLHCREALLRHPTACSSSIHCSIATESTNCVILMESQNLVLKFCVLPPEYSWHAGCFLHLLMVNYSYSCTLWMEHWALLWGLPVQIQVMFVDKPYYLWINDQWTTVANLFSGKIWGKLKFL